LERTRIVLIDMSPLLREIVRETLSREPDLDVVAEHAATVDIGEAVERGHADFVIVGEDARAAESVRALVASDRGLRALELHADGRESVLYELRPHRVALGELSPDALLRTIRAVPGWDTDTGESRAVRDTTSERTT
jgi:DNA-binding NarL/FixJ family response regulator